MTLWTNFFLNAGGEFLDKNGGILTDGPEAIEATKLYQALLTKVAPPGVAGFNWMESMASFTQGRSAMWIDGVGWAPPLEDPAASRIVGKVGYTVVPRGSKGQYTATYGGGVGTPAAGQTAPLPGQEWRPPSYWPFIVPALVVVLAVIIIPWVFTIWMSLNEWKVGSPTTFVGIANYLRMPNDPRFVEAVVHTIYYTALSVLLPVVLGTLAAVVFHQNFAVRGFLRGIFIMPMMATPVAIA